MCKAREHIHTIIVYTKHYCDESSDVDVVFFFFFQAEDGIRDVERSRGLGDVYKRQDYRGISV